MSLTSKFIQSLIALAGSIPATTAAAAPPRPEPASAVSTGSPASIEFASNLPAKLDSVRPLEPAARFGQVWPRVDFVEFQRAIPSGPTASTMSPAEAFRRATDRR